MVYVSRLYCEKFQKEKNEVLNQNTQDFLGEQRFADIVNAFEDSKVPFKSEDKKILFYPVYNKHNNLSEIIFIWDHSEVKTDGRVEQKVTKRINRSVRKFIRRKIKKETGK